MSAGASSARGEKLTWTQKELDAMTAEELFQSYKRTGNEELKWPLVMRYVGRSGQQRAVFRAGPLPH